MAEAKIIQIMKAPWGQAVLGLGDDGRVYKADNEYLNKPVWKLWTGTLLENPEVSLKTLLPKHKNDLMGAIVDHREGRGKLWAVVSNDIQALQNAHSMTQWIPYVDNNESVIFCILPPCKTRDDAKLMAEATFGELEWIN